MLLVQMDQVRRETDQVLVGALPVQPADGVVLVVGVVVALLGAAHLIAGSQHRRALRQQQRGQQDFKMDREEDLIEAQKQIKSEIQKKTEMKELKDMAKKSTKTLLEGLFKDTIGDRQLKIEFTK